MRSLLFVKPSSSAFIIKDQALLSKHFSLKVFDFEKSQGLGFILKTFQFILFYLIHGRKCDHTLIWFADFHAFAPVLLTKIFNNKSNVILGGSDVNSVTEINYGVDKSSFKRKVVRSIITSADLLLPVDKSLANKIIADYGSTSINEVIIVPTGYDSQKWNISKSDRNQIITVAVFNDSKRILVKGLDRFLEVAKLLPERAFTIVGAPDDPLSHFDSVPNNVRFTGLLTPEELRLEYSKSNIYMQLSRSEGLPNAVCEAMLCGCYPICTDVGGMKSLVSDLGSTLTDYDPTIVVSVINETWDTLDEKSANRRRQHIIDNYSESQREKVLLKLLT